MGIIKGHIFKVCNAAYSLFLFPFLSFHFNQNSNIPPSFFKLGYKNILSLEKKLEEQKVLKKLRRLFLNQKKKLKVKLEMKLSQNLKIMKQMDPLKLFHIGDVNHQLEGFQLKKNQKYGLKKIEKMPKQLKSSLSSIYFLFFLSYFFFLFYFIIYFYVFFMKNLTILGINQMKMDPQVIKKIIMKNLTNLKQQKENRIVQLMNLRCVKKKKKTQILNVLKFTLQI